MSNYVFHFAQPWWLLAGLLAVPAVALAWRNLAPLGTVRRVLAAALRAVVLLLLAVLLARPDLTRKGEQLALIAVLDRSQSIPQPLQEGALAYLGEAASHKPPKDRLAVVDVAESAWISRLPSVSPEIPQRNLALEGTQSNLADGVQMALAIAPPDAGVRILLASDGNETAGDLRDVVRVAAANGIPLDVLPLRYDHKQEVVFRRLAVPSRARSGQTVDVRFVLTSTGPASGRLELSVNGQVQDLDATSDAVAVPVRLQPGTNVKTVSLPLGQRGVHEFEAVFIPDGPDCDRLSQNNRAGGVTFVAGPGRVLVVDADGSSGMELAQALRTAQVDARHIRAADFPSQISSLLDTDAVVLVNTGVTFGDADGFTLRQQEMLCRYVTELGGGLVMVGGPESFGAGGWIGSPVAEVLPVDLDPPQKKQMPKGALVLIMHACEMPQGNYWGKTVALAAVNALSRLDLVGVLDYGWGAGNEHWVFPLGTVGDKSAVSGAIRQMEMGDMPDFGPPMQAAHDALKGVSAGQKHVIIISDGDPALPPPKLLADYQKAGISCSGVTVFPHSPADIANLGKIAQATGGRAYNVKDPNKLPQIFIKEAQVVRRSLIIEEPFTPRLISSLGEILKGIGGALPPLDGLVLTGPKGGPTQLLLANDEGLPLLATGQAGLGRTVAFTSSADSRWARTWLAWGGYGRFWEQTVRWAARPGQSADCELFADVQGRNVTLTVDAVDAEGKFVRMSGIIAQVIAPDMSVREVPLRQSGPGRYVADFQAGPSGSYLVNVRYRKAGSDGQTGLAQSVVMVPYAPEFRDLKDNAALLAEAAAATGGRVLGGDPASTDLFDRAGVRFPSTPLPLTEPLLLAWVVLFLLDVAARRIALDVRAMWRRVASAVRLRRRPAQAAGTLDHLKARLETVKKRLAGRPRDEHAGRKFQAGPGPVEPMPMADASAPKAETRPPAEPKKTAPPAAAESEDRTHLDRLLKARREARRKQNPDGPKND